QTIDHVFCPQESISGLPCFLNFKQLIDPKNGLTIENAVVFRVTLTESVMNLNSIQRWDELKNRMSRKIDFLCLSVEKFGRSPRQLKSECKMIEGFEWNILIESDEKKFGFFLQCEKVYLGGKFFVMSDLKRNVLIGDLQISIPDLDSTNLFPNCLWRGAENSVIKLKISENENEISRFNPQYLINLWQFLQRYNYIRKPTSLNEQHFENLLNSAVVENEIRLLNDQEKENCRKLITHLVDYLQLEYENESSSKILMADPPDPDFRRRRIWRGGNFSKRYKLENFSDNKVADYGNFKPQQILNLLDYMIEMKFIANLTADQWDRCSNLLDADLEQDVYDPVKNEIEKEILEDCKIHDDLQGSFNEEDLEKRKMRSRK
uniref:Uncharacterized protein n=1 Tax=Romanomermis culicivorax TaxID=13658 RepID=A0A915J5N6_ROMCU